MLSAQSVFLPDLHAELRPEMFKHRTKPVEGSRHCDHNCTSLTEALILPSLSRPIRECNAPDE